MHAGEYVYCQQSGHGVPGHGLGSSTVEHTVLWPLTRAGPSTATGFQGASLRVSRNGGEKGGLFTILLWRLNGPERA